MGTIFPDVEVALRAAIVAGLAGSSNPVASNVTVATIKPAPTVTPYPSRIVVIRSDGAAQKERDITREELVGVNVYANTYGDASNLAALVEAICRSVKAGPIKLIETMMSPTRVDTESTASPEQRYMTLRVTVKASDF